MYVNDLDVLVVANDAVGRFTDSAVFKFLCEERGNSNEWKERESPS